MVATTALICASAVTLSACMANPGPAPIVEEDTATLATETTSTSPTTTPAEEDDATERTTVAVGVDPLTSGLNPHLVANNTELVEQIADLVLPSTFHNGQMDADVLVSAGEVSAPEGVAQRVRYEISPQAQWSDGTPITGSDFSYLWKSMVTTSGVESPAGYRAISAVNFSEGGRVVTVDFSQRVADWRLLFNDLLPAHLLQDSSNSFVQALASGIPASAGRFMVANVDRARGVITLNRNDRFWGESPANIDVLQLRAVRNTTAAVDMLRSGQIGFADITPAQTTLGALDLLPGVGTEVVSPARQLRLHLSTAPSALDDVTLRRDIVSLIDTSLVARLATGRDDLLEVPYGGARTLNTRSAEDLRERSQTQPIRIAVDPTDVVAHNAANTIVDMLATNGVQATTVTDRLTTITSQLLPDGDVDAVLTWEDTNVTSLNMANLFLCVASASTTASTSAAPGDSADTDSADNADTGDSADSSNSGPASTAAGTSSAVTSAGSPAASAGAESSASPTGEPSGNPDAEPTGEGAPWAGDLSGACLPGADETLASILSGQLSASDALAQVREINADQALYIPLLDETRIHALGRGIIGPGPDVADWGQGLVSAPLWKEDPDNEPQ